MLVNALVNFHDLARLWGLLEEDHLATMIQHTIF